MYNNGSAYTMTWTGIHLDSVTTGGVTTTYEYDSSGMRTTKTVGNKTYEYLYYGGRLVQYHDPPHGTLYFHYDENGSPLGFTYNGESGTADYYYVLNLQGDIVQLRNISGGIECNYSYDAWGKLLSVTNASGTETTSSSSVALLNPLRYRGYVYDSDTDFYYLQSRYYDPTIGRFINADGLVSNGTGVIGYNMFAYCNNNPVMCVDSSGLRPIDSLSIQSETSQQKDMSFTYMLSMAQSGSYQNFGAAPEYIESTDKKQNCYAYVLGVAGAKYVEDTKTGLTDPSVEAVSELLTNNLSQENIGVRKLDTPYSYIRNDEYRIAVRTNNKDDYHFMMQHSDGTWSQKFTDVNSENLGDINPTLINWDGAQLKIVNYGDGERVYLQRVRNKYVSETVYFAVKK